MVELLDLADRYGFESLAQSIEKQLCSVINPTNVLQLLFHSEIYNAPLLNQTCLNFVDTNAELILSSKDVLTLQSEHLKYLTDSNVSCLNVCIQTATSSV